MRALGTLLDRHAGAILLSSLAALAVLALVPAVMA
jgi:hypothetical protein